MAIDINIPSQVKNYANLAGFPATGTLKTIFIAEDTNKTYRWTGSAYVEISPAGATGITIGTTAITSGTVGRVLFEGTGNVVQESANLFWDNTNVRLGIGTSSPARKIDILGSGDVLTGIKTTSSTGAASHVVLNDANAQFEFGMWGSARTGYGAITAGNAYLFGSGDFAITSNANIKFGTGATPNERMRLFSTGNLAINTTTDAGFKLDVNGTARVQGLGTFGSSIRVIGQGIFGANGINNAGVVGIDQNGTSSAARIYMCNGAGSAYPIWFDAGGNSYFNTGGNVGIGTSSPTNKLHVVGSAGFDNGASGDSITLLNDGFIKSSLIRFRGFSTQFFIQDNSYNTKFAVSTSGSLSYFNTGGNVAIGTTTDAGYKLDVNGTARVSGALTGLGAGTIFNSTNNTFFHSASGGVSTIDYYNGFVIQNAGQAVFKTAYNGNSRFLRQSIFGTDGVNNASAQVQIDSTTKGFLPPRMTTIEKNAIASPATGLMVYDTTLNVISFYNGTMWV